MALYPMKMTVFRSEGAIGARVRSARKRLGMRVNELAKAVNVSAAVIENIEGGRKLDLNISEVLNLAMALEVPPVFLLAPIGSPNRVLDLPNLNEAFAKMTVLEFDAWLSNNPAGAYRPVSMSERNDRYELQILREREAEQTELRRLTVQSEQESMAMPATAAAAALLGTTRDRIAATKERIERLELILRAAGWSIDSAGS